MIMAYTISCLILGIQIGHTWFDHKLYRHNYAYHLVSLWVEKIKNSFKRVSEDSGDINNNENFKKIKF